MTISTGHSKPLLLEGPATETQTKADKITYEPFKNVHYQLNDINLHVTPPYLLLGHYKVPELTTSWTPQLPNTNFLNTHTQDLETIKLINGEVHTNNDKDGENETNLKSSSVSVSVQTEEFQELFLRPDLWYKQWQLWLNQQENKALKVLLIILMGLVVAMFWYLRYQVSKGKIAYFF